MKAVVLHRVGLLAYSCPKQGQDFTPSVAPLYPNSGQVPPPWQKMATFVTVQGTQLDLINTPTQSTLVKDYNIVWKFEINAPPELWKT